MYMGAINELEKKWKDSKKAPKEAVEEIFKEVKEAIRAHYEKKLRELQQLSTQATELEQKMAVASKIDELRSWKIELVD